MAAPSHDVPVSLFVNGQLLIPLTGHAPIPGGFAWSAKSDDPAVATVAVHPVHVGPFPVISWALMIHGLKIGNTKIHVQESQATNPPNTRYAFTIDLTVNGLQA
jgi:hypothetical protein